MSVEFYWVVVILTTFVSAARFTRLAVIDKFPPVKAVRTWYEDKMDGSDWQWLTMCAYCFAIYPTILIVGLGIWAGVYHPANYYDHDAGFVAWWIVNGIFALAYLAAMTVARDGAVGEDD